MKKRSIILGSVLGLTLTATGVFAAVNLTDIPADHWAKSAVENLVGSGVIKGYEDGTFKGNNNITRYETSVIVDKNNAVWMKKMEDMEKAMNEKMAAMEKTMTAMQTQLDALEKMVVKAEMYVAALDGKQEVPAVDTTGTGTASFELVGNKLTYSIEVKDLSGAVTGAHIHMGKVGEKGDAVQTITFDGMKAAGSWTMTDEQVKNLQGGMYYVNVHTEKNAEGEIRGQIVPKA